PPEENSATSSGIGIPALPDHYHIGASALGGARGARTSTLAGVHRMRIISLRSFGALAATLLASTAAMAQSQYDDYACRQYADAQVAPYRDQANANTVGSTIIGAGLGAALGGAIGGGRGAGIGAASGAAVGLGTGAANAQAAGYDLQQRYNAFYYQCMQSR